MTELYIPGTPLTGEQYIWLEAHYFVLESYVNKYTGYSNTILYNKEKNNTVIPRHLLEIGSDKKKTEEKYRKLIVYLNELAVFLHEQYKLVYPTLSEYRT